MMKKLIPAAVLMSLFGAAQAQSVIYGLVDMSYGKNEIASPGQKEDIFSGGDGGGHGGTQGNSTTKIGLKGSNDVGSGVKANFNFETGGIHSDGSVQGALFSRQAWAGLSGSMGEVRVGLQDSVAFQTMIAFDFNGASNAASAQGNAGAGTFFGTLQSLDRQVQYIAPTMGGLKVQLGFQPAGNVVGAESVVAAAATYTIGPVAAAAVYESKSTTAGKDFMSAAASYDLGMAKFMVGYTDGGKTMNGYTVGVSAPVAGVTVGGHYSLNYGNDMSATELFVNKEIFKGTYAYVDFAQQNIGGSVSRKKTERQAYAAGVIFTF
jgi:predicted porin